MTGLWALLALLGVALLVGVGMLTVAGIALVRGPAGTDRVWGRAFLAAGVAGVVMYGAVVVAAWTGGAL